jgi:aryl-alcohol dehydrogenase-like predicted oxidoreductase
LSILRPSQPLHVATKVRLLVDKELDLRPLVVASVRESLQRLRMPRVTLLQVHNSITPFRGDEPTSLTPDDILGPQGMLAAMEDLRAEGVVDHFGLTGIGNPDSLREVMRSKRFATIQAPFHLLNPSALIDTPDCFHEPDYGGFLRTAHDLGMGLFAIRVYAAGALLGALPSAHTLKTPFFPLSLYERDRDRARRLSETLGSSQALQELALRYVLSQEAFASAILGFGQSNHIDAAVRVASLGSLSHNNAKQATELIRQLVSSPEKRAIDA